MFGENLKRKSIPAKAVSKRRNNKAATDEEEQDKEGVCDLRKLKATLENFFQSLVALGSVTLLLGWWFSVC